MRLVRTDLDQFRNLVTQTVNLHPHYNLLVGKNGQGKTNFLEAIGFLGTLKSFRAASRAEIIREGSDVCRVSSVIHGRGMLGSASFSLTRKGRAQFLDGKQIASPEEYLTAVRVVSFIPEDVGLVSGPPSRRRKIIDRSVFEVWPEYVRDYRQYLRVLRQRNALLRRRDFAPEELKSWNQSLAECGATLVRKRIMLLSKTNPIMEEIGATLDLERGTHLRYQPSFMGVIGSPGTLDQNSSGLMETILGKLEEVQEREKEIGHTTIGPHRDNIVFTAGGERDMGRYGSQGQKRGAVLSFKLALARVIKETRDVWPLVLLDDVASELDSVKRKALGSLVRNMDAQFIISTTTEEPQFLDRQEGYVFRVVNGMLERLQ
jgi:DNA replication and repair protein RecF